MNPRILLVITVLALAHSPSFGQGYFLFTATKNSVWDHFTTGVPMSGGGHTMVGFLWGPASTVGRLGTNGSPITNTGPLSPNTWDDILNDPQFHFATNATSGLLVAQPVNASGLAVGGIGYLAGATFPVLGTAGGQIYTIYCIGWDSAYATPFQAALAGNPSVGWSNPFQYAAGSGPTSTPLNFSSSGMQPFAVGIPEPAPFALGGLGAAALLVVRRRRSEFQKRSRPFDS